MRKKTNNQIRDYLGMMFPAIDGSWKKEKGVHYVKNGGDYYM